MYSDLKLKSSIRNYCSLYYISEKYACIANYADNLPRDFT
jgi:hypothetical protein